MILVAAGVRTSENVSKNKNCVGDNNNDNNNNEDDNDMERTYVDPAPSFKGRMPALATETIVLFN